MNKKRLLVASLMVGIFMAGGFTAYLSAHTALAQEGTVELGVRAPRLLPTNPFYFLKEWRRGIQRLFTFNPVAKAALELNFTDEKAVELKTVEEKRSDDAKGIEKAIKNYEEATDRLEQRLEALKDMSNNPNLDRLLADLALRRERHIKLFEDLSSKLENKTNRRAKAEEQKERLEKMKDETPEDEMESEENEDADNGVEDDDADENRLEAGEEDEVKLTATAVINNEGFSPKTVEVKKGGRVTWTNKGLVPSWPASAMHPTHKVYPGSDIEKCGTSEASKIFDSCVGIAPGGEWTFQFNEVGSWKYHDHLNPSHFATVEVEE